MQGGEYGQAFGGLLTLGTSTGKPDEPQMTTVRVSDIFRISWLSRAAMARHGNTVEVQTAKVFLLQPGGKVRFMMVDDPASVQKLRHWANANQAYQSRAA